MPLVLATDKVFHYEPEIVILTGTIKIKTFPGVQNYENFSDSILH
jgi:hypothetical protein